MHGIRLAAEEESWYTMGMIYAAFVLLAALVVFLSLKLSKYVDLLDKTTNVSGAFIGGVLLAAVTSLPELFTSLSAVLFLRENELVTGNILGSNLFNLATLGIAVAIMFRGFSRAKVQKHHTVTVALCLGIYGLIALPTFIKGTPRLGFVNIVTPFIFAVYILNLFLTPKTEEASQPEENVLSVKQLVVRFIAAAVLLVAVSIAITYIADSVANKHNLGKTFAGALLLGLTTSLPELVSTLSLCKRGNFNASVGNIAGSNIFNFCILCLADLLSFRKGNTDIYPFFSDGAAGFQSMLLLVLGAAASIFAIILLLVKTRKNQNPEKRLLGHAVTLSSGTLMTACYFLFLILSTVL